MATLKLSAYEREDDYCVRILLEGEKFEVICETYEQAINTHKELVKFSDYLVDFVKNKCLTDTLEAIKDKRSECSSKFLGYDEGLCDGLDTAYEIVEHVLKK